MKNIKAKLPKGKGKPQTGKRDGKTEAKTTGKHKGSRAGAEKRNDKVVGSGAGNRDGATGSTVRKRCVKLLLIFVLSSFVVVLLKTKRVSHATTTFCCLEAPRFSVCRFVLR